MVFHSGAISQISFWNTGRGPLLHWPNYWPLRDEDELNQEQEAFPTAFGRLYEKVLTVYNVTRSYADGSLFFWD